LTRFYVYTLIDPRNNRPFYVGKGCNGRHLQHVKGIKNNHRYVTHNPVKNNVIREILDQGFCDVDYTIVPCESEQDAFDQECQLIDQIGIENLTNMTQGGDQGPYQGKLVDQYNIYGEFIRTWNSALEAANFYGRDYSTTISRSCRNNQFSKRPFGYIWTYHDIKPDFEHIWKTVRPVYQYNLNREYIDRYPSAIEAARQVLSNPRRSYEIRQAAEKNWVCKGYLWKFSKMQSIL